MTNNPYLSGTFREQFADVANLFAKNIEIGADHGASFAMTLNGELVVDIWGGWADAKKSSLWERDTLVNVYSTTKTMTALCALILADQGQLDLDAPVSSYWPAFAANGKAAVTVSQVLSHSSGVCGWRDPITPEDLFDWPKATALLAAQAPFWPPGTAPGYHSLTQGYLVGEVVRRITGRSLGTFFREEIAGPLGADFHIGLPPKNDGRVAALISPAQLIPSDMPGLSDLTRNMIENPRLDVGITGTRAWRGAEIPAANGHGNARSVAQIQTILACSGHAQGKTFLSDSTIRRALVPQIEGTDLVLGLHAKYGLGFGLAPMIPLPGSDCLFWGGYGGSLVVIDTARHATYAYVMNKMGMTTIGDERALGLIERASRAL
jgi:CubicO group peptidase (beta-lactamase class C family)